MWEVILLRYAKRAVIFSVETSYIITCDFALIHGTNAYGYSYVFALLRGQIYFVTLLCQVLFLFISCGFGLFE